MKDGEVKCLSCGRGLNRTDLNCWRCGSRDLTAFTDMPGVSDKVFGTSKESPQYFTIDGKGSLVPHSERNRVVSLEPYPPEGSVYIKVDGLSFLSIAPDGLHMFQYGKGWKRILNKKQLETTLDSVKG